LIDIYSDISIPGNNMAIPIPIIIHLSIDFVNIATI
jgi:hypothetical protein